LLAGWQPLKIFTCPLDGKIHDNRQVVEQAARLGIPVQLSPMTEADLAALAAQGCEALLLGSYDWKVPDWRPYLPHAVNFHPRRYRRHAGRFRWCAPFWSNAANGGELPCGGAAL
jgi:methionyl-tRNA formyltransferase